MIYSKKTFKFEYFEVTELSDGRFHVVSELYVADYIVDTIDEVRKSVRKIMNQYR